MYHQQYNKSIDKQVRQLKLMSAICLGTGLLIVSTLSSYYWDLYHRARDYDLVFETADEVLAALAEADGTEYTYGVHPTYDSCNKFDESVDEQFDTHWRLAFQFNAIVYTMFTGLTVCSFAGLIYS